MSNQIAVPVNATAISTSGLALFTSVLSELSADGIAPIAAVQLEQLGSNFHVNGEFAASTKDLLKRSIAKSTRAQPVTVGWREGDSASLLAKTTSGQAAALLSLLIENPFGSSGSGEILSRLYIRLLLGESLIISIS